MRLFLIPLLGLSLSGCLARTAMDIVTLPVKVVSAGVDAATTSQSEADQRRGRQIREEEERLGRPDPVGRRLRAGARPGGVLARERDDAEAVGRRGERRIQGGQGGAGADDDPRRRREPVVHDRPLVVERSGGKQVGEQVAELEEDGVVERGDGARL